MDILNQILVLAEDGKISDQKLSQSFPQYPRKLYYSALGRQINKGLIEKKEDGYYITEKGKEKVNRTLEQIHFLNNKTWDGYLTCVIYNIPEKERKKRDILRGRLIEEGFALFKDGIWVSNLPPSSEFENFIQNKNLDKNILVSRLGPIKEKEFVHFSIEPSKELKIFITKGKDFLLEKNKNRFEAKKLVFSYALIFKNRLKIPIRFLSKDSLILQADQIYQKIKPYCYL